MTPNPGLLRGILRKCDHNTLQRQIIRSFTTGSNHARERRTFRSSSGPTMQAF